MADRGDSQQVCEARVVVLGPRGVGKTSLLRTLVGVGEEHITDTGLNVVKVDAASLLDWTLHDGATFD